MMNANNGGGGWRVAEGRGTPTTARGEEMHHEGDGVIGNPAVSSQAGEQGNDEE